MKISGGDKCGACENGRRSPAAVQEAESGAAQITVPCIWTSMTGFFALSVRSRSFPSKGPLAIPGLRVTRTSYSRPS